MHQAGDQQAPASQNIQTATEASPTEPQHEPLPPDNGGKTVLLIGIGIALLVVGAIIGYVLRQGEVASLQQRIDNAQIQQGAVDETNGAKEQTSSVAKADASQVSAGVDCMEKVSGARSILTKAVFKDKDEDGRSIQVEHSSKTSTFKWLTVVPDIYDAQCNKTGATLRDLKSNEYITLYLSGETVNEGQVLAIQRLNN